MKLKTLKDIEIYTYALSKPLTCESYRKRLKQEAIKWIKELDLDNSFRHRGDAINWIKEFFNITEEVLK